MINEIAPKITDKINPDQKGKIVSYLNVYNYGILRKSPELMRDIDLFTLDGILLILFIRYTMNRKIERKAPDFSSYFIELFGYLQDKNASLIFYGGSKSDMIKFLKIIEENYPKLNVVVGLNGYDNTEEDVTKKIFENNIDVVIAGLGTPKQELFLTNLKKKGFTGTSYSCGAFISQTASRGKEYFPSKIDKLHLRWLYRIFDDPKLLKRYGIRYPIALTLLFKDWIQKK